MSMDDPERKRVIAQLSDGLSRYFRLTGPRLTDEDEVIAGLAEYVASTFPRGVAATTCTGRLPRREDEGEMWACACTSACMNWVRVYDEDVERLESAERLLRAAYKDCPPEDVPMEVLAWLNPQAATDTAGETPNGS